LKRKGCQGKAIPERKKKARRAKARDEGRRRAMLKQRGITGKRMGGVR